MTESTDSDIIELQSRENAGLRAELTAAREALKGLRDAHSLIIDRLCESLMPDSPIENARGEFVLDAMGACQIIRRLKEDHRASREANRVMRGSAHKLVDAMETCHQCSATLLVEDGPTYCSEGGCSYDCEDHEDRDKPHCTPISILHANLKRVLKSKALADQPASQPAKETNDA